MAHSQAPDVVEIYAVGGAQPGVGVWSAVLTCKGRRKSIGDHELQATGPRMELRAALEALRQLSRPCHVRFTTTSQGVVRGMTEWLPGWVERGWKGAQGRPVHNRDLWEALRDEAARHEVEWVWARSGTHPLARELDERLAALLAEGAQARKAAPAPTTAVPNPFDWPPPRVIEQGTLFARHQVT